MDNTFVINNKVYKAKPFTFNLVCDLEDRGISLSDIDNKTMSLMRAYFSLCAGRDAEYAGSQLEQHIMNGGKFGDLMEVMGKEIEDSGFFRSLSKNEEEEAPTTQTKKTK